MNEYIERVIDEAVRAVNRRVQINKAEAEKLSVAFDPAEKKEMMKAVRAYERQLRSLWRAFEKKGKPQVREAQNQIFDSFAARSCSPPSGLLISASSSLLRHWKSWRRTSSLAKFTMR